MKIACDTETGGLNPDINPILSVAFYTPDHEFYIQIKGERQYCDKKALEVNGLNPDEGVSRAEAQGLIIDFWNKLGRPKFELIGHNVGPFDAPFLKQLALPNGMIDYHFYDTMVACALLKDCGKINPERMKLQSVCDYFGITYEAHNALEDAKAAWKVWHKCLDIIKGHPVRDSGDAFLV